MAGLNKFLKKGEKMRELKFRVWTGDYMFKPSNPAYFAFYIDALDGKVNIGKTDMGNFYLSQESNFLPLQYTGLKDKNGNEIYEGDIVKFRSTGLKPYGKDTPKDGVLGCVKFHLGGFYVFSGGVYYQFGDDKSWIVIGNIYENPDLAGKITNRCD